MLSLVIPCHNESRRLVPVAHGALAHLSQWPGGSELILVDDGSTDDTWMRMERIRRNSPDRVRTVRLRENAGKGAAVRAGFMVARGRVWGYADADGSAAWSGLGRLAQALAEPGVGASVGERTTGDTIAHPARRALGALFRGAVALLADTGVDDTQCGFKLFRASAVRPLLSRLTIDRYAFDVELLHLLKQRGHAVVGVPVTWTHKAGSRVRPVRDGLRMVRDLVRWRATPRRPFAIPMPRTSAFRYSSSP
ncbi:MAG: glycosyltransferase [Gemmatimonadetes bacterium]|nr:glycosyltransferase [Gemmatimonadota bacterium]